MESRRYADLGGRFPSWYVLRVFFYRFPKIYAGEMEI